MNKFLNQLINEHTPNKPSEINKEFIQNIVLDIHSKLKPQSSKILLKEIKQFGMEIAVQNLVSRIATDMLMAIGAEKVSIKYIKQIKTKKTK